MWTNLKNEVQLIAVCVVDEYDHKKITAVEESDGRDSSMIRRPIASIERHNLGHHCP